MLKKSFLLRVFDAANMQRWNDKIRPVDLRELDKQAHKMIIAYILGKYEQDNKAFSWIDVIEGGIFEFLQRLVITDLKPQIFYKIKEDPSQYKKLNEWVYQQLKPVTSPLGEDFGRRFKHYFSDTRENVNKRVLAAAHFYATKWEFDIIERANPKGYEIAEIGRDLERRQERYLDLKGLQELVLHVNLRNFVSLCGQLRFQVRWSHLHMVPRTSVLGHMLIIAIFCYLFSLEIGACSNRCINNFFTGLFHDLPEVLTRDIISPVKKSFKEFEEMIKIYEKQQMKKEVYNLIPKDWHAEMKMFTEDEFSSIVMIDGKKSRTKSDEINIHFNEDRFNPRDGEIVEASDRLAAFIEAFLTLENGINAPELVEAKKSVKTRYKGINIAGINFGDIYSDFE
ncbi:MAG: HD domain-containing protein [Nitrospirota bacterium]|nr:HD domain-containing protein [Nitrospirota bacterium]